MDPIIDRMRAEQQPDIDPVIAQMRDMQDQTHSHAALNVAIQSQQNPDQAAVHNALAKRYNTTPDVVAAFPQEFKDRMAVELARSNLDGAPQLQQRLVAQPQAAAMIHDDVPNASAIERVLSAAGGHQHGSPEGLGRGVQQRRGRAQHCAGCVPRHRRPDDRARLVRHARRGRMVPHEGRPVPGQPAGTPADQQRPLHVKGSEHGRQSAGPAVANHAIGHDDRIGCARVDGRPKRPRGAQGRRRARHQGDVVPRVVERRGHGPQHLHADGQPPVGGKGGAGRVHDQHDARRDAPVGAGQPRAAPGVGASCPAASRTKRRASG
jgi:hypothetical protein